MIPRTHLQSPETGAPGEAELQTDVMRFFALLAICLVALMSLAREPAEERQAAAAQPPVERKTEPPRPTPRPEPRPATATLPARPAAPPPAVPANDTSAPAPPPSPAAPADETAPQLRFASPRALERLERTGEVVVFAISEGTGYRWSGARVRFGPDRLPETLYLMDPATVPPGLRSALGRVVPDASGATWGVTLSPAIRARLDRHLAGGARGLLLIDAAGNVIAAGSGP